MKAELLAQMMAMASTEDPSSTKAEIKSLVSRYNTETLREKAEQKTAWDGVEHEEGEEFIFQPNTLDAEFESNYASFKEKDQAQRELIAVEQKKNLEKKKEILGSLKLLIQDEENIGKAFGTFKELSDEWNKIGQVPGDKHREIQDDFIRLRDDFFYNINIYKELKEHDLKINEKIKIDLIAAVKAVNTELPIRELDLEVRSLQSKWMEVGPSARETYMQMADEFFGACREHISKIKDHYNELQKEQDVNLEKKKELVVQLDAFVDLDIQNHGTWKKKTEQVLALQEAWRSIGFARKVDNEVVWEEFRGKCDKFFATKQAFYDSRRDVHNESKKKKDELIVKAKELSTNTNWKETTQALIGLQDEWKKVGPAAHFEEQKLWNEFRAACDVYFKAKKTHFGSMDKEQAENLKLKEALVEEINTSKLSGNKHEDILKLKEFSVKWHEIGHVPKRDLQVVYDKYNAALDVKYTQLNVNDEERNILSFKQRIGGNSQGQLHKERGFILGKVEKIQSMIRQYEGNMMLFTGKGADAMRREIDKKIKAGEREIAELEKKLDLIDD
ncbi:MAG: hypothetical protein ACI84C_000846 [Flavobacteriales bacterium]|jgi:hypothetical protein